MKKNVVIVLLVVLAFWLGTRMTEAAPVDTERPDYYQPVEIHIRTVGPIGVPFEWWSDDGGGGVVWLGTGPGFRVFMNGEERFPVPCPVPGGCRPVEEVENESLSDG